METVLTEIKREHDEARALIKKIDGSKRMSWEDVKELYIMLKGHHEAEEEVVFPKVRDVDTKAEKLVEHLIEEHEQAQDVLKTMIDAHEFDREAFGELRTVLEEHMDEEETDLFKKARKGFSEEDLQAALEPFEKVEETGKKTAEKEVK